MYDFVYLYTSRVNVMMKLFVVLILSDALFQNLPETLMQNFLCH